MPRDFSAQLNPVVRDLFAYLFALDRSAPPEAVLLWVALALLPVMLALVIAIGACAWLMMRRTVTSAADAAAAAEEEGIADGRALRAAAVARAKKAE